MRKITSGFTIVELLVVIAVIGILTTISLISFTRYQADTRDTQRSSKATILAEALEKYYDKNGEYPGCLAVSDVNASTVTTTVLPGVELNTLLTPKSASTDTNSIKCQDLAVGGSDIFAYVGDGSTACNTGQACLTFTLKYTEEGTGTIKTITSRRNTSIATSGTSSLTATVQGFSQIDTSWTPISNALTYDVQLATDSAFTANVQTQTVTVPTTTLSITGLTFNTQYYFRVRANATNSQGVWSNTDAEATWGLATPVMNATTTSSTSFTATWGAITHTASYTVQCSADGVTWNAGCSTSTAGVSYLFGSAAQGYTYYARVQAVNGAYTSSWSNIDTAITSINNPAAYSLTSSNTLAGGWNWLIGTSNAVCPAGTTPIYDWYHNVNGTNSLWVSGSQYQTVGQGFGWNDSITLSVATRCTTAVATSSYVWAGNTASMSLPWPSSNLSIPGDRTMSWSGSCPKWSTSWTYDWDTNGVVNATGHATAQGTYSNQGIAWGDGNAHVTFSCVGPWGTATDTTTQRYGAGCLPTILVPACTQ